MIDVQERRVSTSSTIDLEHNPKTLEPFAYDQIDGEERSLSKSHLPKSQWIKTSYDSGFWPTYNLASMGAVSMDIFKPVWLKSKPERRLHATSYLDGIRGLASFFVFFHHAVKFLFPDARYAYGTPTKPGSINHNYFFQLPFLRIFIAGAAMVDLFFVISGVVLSTKSLRLIRERELLQTFETLSSATIRRGFRLYLPCIFTTFVIAIMTWMGVPADTAPARRFYRVARGGRLIDQIGLWIQDTIHFTSALGGRSGFEPGTWTIPIEWRCSMVVFLCLLGIANLQTTKMRTGVLIFLQISWSYLDYWDMFLFISGVVIADLSLYRHKKSVHSRNVELLHTVAFIVGLYLLSMPERGDVGPDGAPFGHGWLMNTFYPSWSKHSRDAAEFWPSIGAIIFVATVTHAGPNSWCQKFFNSRFIQYLGDVSFSFYLYHPFIIHSVGSRVMSTMLSIFGREGQGELFCFVVTLAVLLPVTFYVAQLATDHVDKNAVKFARWLFQR